MAITRLRRTATHNRFVWGPGEFTILKPGEPVPEPHVPFGKAPALAKSASDDSPYDRAHDKDAKEAHEFLVAHGFGEDQCPKCGEKLQKSSVKSLRSDLEKAMAKAAPIRRRADGSPLTKAGWEDWEPKDAFTQEHLKQHPEHKKALYDMLNAGAPKPAESQWPKPSGEPWKPAPKAEQKPGFWSSLKHQDDPQPPPPPNPTAPLLDHAGSLPDHELAKPGGDSDHAHLESWLRTAYPNMHGMIQHSPHMDPARGRTTDPVEHTREVLDNLDLTKEDAEGRRATRAATLLHDTGKSLGARQSAHPWLSAQMAEHELPSLHLDPKQHTSAMRAIAHHAVLGEAAQGILTHEHAAARLHDLEGLKATANVGIPDIKSIRMLPEGAAEGARHQIYPTQSLMGKNTETPLHAKAGTTPALPPPTGPGPTPEAAHLFTGNAPDHTQAHAIGSRLVHTPGAWHAHVHSLHVPESLMSPAMREHTNRFHEKKMHEGAWKKDSDMWDRASASLHALHSGDLSKDPVGVALARAGGHGDLVKPSGHTHARAEAILAHHRPFLEHMVRAMHEHQTGVPSPEPPKPEPGSVGSALHNVGYHHPSGGKTMGIPSDLKPSSLAGQPHKDDPNHTIIGTHATQGKVVTMAHTPAEGPMLHMRIGDQRVVLQHPSSGRTLAAHPEHPVWKSLKHLVSNVAGQSTPPPEDVMKAASMTVLRRTGKGTWRTLSGAPLKKAGYVHLESNRDRRHGARKLSDDLEKMHYHNPKGGEKQGLPATVEPHPLAGDEHPSYLGHVIIGNHHSRLVTMHRPTGKLYVHHQMEGIFPMASSAPAVPHFKKDVNSLQHPTWLGLAAKIGHTLEQNKYREG